MSFQFTNNNDSNINKDKIPQFLQGSLKDFQNPQNKSTNEIGPNDPVFGNYFFDNQLKVKSNFPPSEARFDPIRPLNDKKENNSFPNHHRIYKDIFDSSFFAESFDSAKKDSK